MSSLSAVCNPSFADDWSQFRGPKRDGVSRETNLLKAWPEGGPKRLWLSTNLGSGYSGPAIVGEKIYIMGQRTDAQWLLCLDVNDGKELWATRLGDQIYMVAAGGTGCKAVRLTAPDTTEVIYANKVMKNLPGGVVLFDHHLYGYSDSMGWVCQDWLTGDEVWSSKALDKGTLTVAGDKMICLTEDTGVVALADASPKGWKEISRFVLAPQSERRALKAKVWTPPVIAHNRLYVRDQENLWCFEIRAGVSPSKPADTHN